MKHRTRCFVPSMVKDRKVDTELITGSTANACLKESSSTYERHERRKVSLGATVKGHTVSECILSVHDTVPCHNDLLPSHQFQLLSDTA